jgi:RNA polymerase sigma-B factor
MVFPDPMHTMTSPSSLAPARRDAALHARYHRDRDRETRDALVARYLPLAEHLARRYRGGNEDEDLRQIAALGLLKALERFDPARGLAFSTFAVPTILGELRRYFRDHGWSVRPPRDVQDLALRLDRVTDELTGQLGRAPTPMELAARCGSTIEQVLEARASATAHRAISIDVPRTDDGEEPSNLLGGQTDPGFARAEDAADLEHLLQRLPARERTVLQLRFDDELTQREIGERIGVSQMQVSRLIRQSITTLRDARSSDDARAQRENVMGISHA